MRLVRPLGLGGKLFKTRIIEPYTHGPPAAVVDIQGDGHVGTNFAGIAHIRLAEYARLVSCRAQADRVVENALVADMEGVVSQGAWWVARMTGVVGRDSVLFIVNRRIQRSRHHPTTKSKPPG